MSRGSASESVGTMWKYMTLLAAAMFLVLLIGGEDRGQLRYGLRPQPVPAPVPVVVAEPAPEVALASFAPGEPAAPVATVAPVAPVAAAPAADPPAPAPAPAAAAVPLPRAAPAPAPDPAPEPAPELAAAPLPVRYVDADAVNLRAGPSTETAVIGRLTRREAVAVVGAAVDGWLRVRLEGDGGEGYVAARFLTDVAPE
jgi:pyruvate/2-oxoglutarate dehydrogenase complex dihydrolipoamide acyltransferase (E2) component